MCLLFTEFASASDADHFLNVIINIIIAAIKKKVRIYHYTHKNYILVSIPIQHDVVVVDMPLN